MCREILGVEWPARAPTVSLRDRQEMKTVRGRVSCRAPAPHGRSPELIIASGSSDWPCRGRRRERKRQSSASSGRYRSSDASGTQTGLRRAYMVLADLHQRRGGCSVDPGPALTWAARSALLDRTDKATEVSEKAPPPSASIAAWRIDSPATDIGIKLHLVGTVRVSLR